MCSSSTSKPASTSDARGVDVVLGDPGRGRRSVADRIICMHSGLTASGTQRARARRWTGRWRPGRRARAGRRSWRRSRGRRRRAGPGPAPTPAPTMMTSLVGAPLGRDREVGDGGQADPAAARREVVVDQLVGDQPVRRPALEGGGLDHPVAQPDRAELGGREDVRGHAETITRSSFGSGSSCYGLTRIVTVSVESSRATTECGTRSGRCSRSPGRSSTSSSAWLRRT